MSSVCRATQKKIYKKITGKQSGSESSTGGPGPGGFLFTRSSGQQKTQAKSSSPARAALGNEEEKLGIFTSSVTPNSVSSSRQGNLFHFDSSHFEKKRQSQNAS